MYDIARIEVLAGPQGTLYGASAEAGALRIITNQPDTSGYAANYSMGVDMVAHGGIGYTAEGMLNLPISQSAAIRLVGWREHDAGISTTRPGRARSPPRASRSATHRVACLRAAMHPARCSSASGTPATTTTTPIPAGRAPR